MIAIVTAAISEENLAACLKFGQQYEVRVLLDGARHFMEDLRYEKIENTDPASLHFLKAIGDAGAGSEPVFQVWARFPDFMFLQLEKTDANSGPCYNRSPVPNLFFMN